MRKKGKQGMFGPFSLGDSLRVYRLQHRAIALDPIKHLTQPQTPLREAWLALLTQQAMGQPAYVLCDADRGEAFVQIRYRLHQAAADLTYLAPLLTDDRRAAAAWSALLDGACLDLAERGIERVFASLPERGAETEVFHQAGFAQYTGEDIYCLSRPDAASHPVPSLPVRPQRLDDLPALQRLCVAITPQRVRQAEGGIVAAADKTKKCQHYILPGGSRDDLAAALILQTGGSAYWMRMLVHPEACHVVPDLIQFGLAALASSPERQVYCSVRKYEGGMKAALEAAGFELHAARALVVKQTAAWVRVAIQEAVPVLKGGAEPVGPTYHISGDPEYQPSNGRLAAGPNRRTW